MSWHLAALGPRGPPWQRGVQRVKAQSLEVQRVAEVPRAAAQASAAGQAEEGEGSHSDGGTKSISHPRNKNEPLFVGITGESSFPRFLRWCRIPSIHSTTALLDLDMGKAIVGGLRFRNEHEPGCILCIIYRDVRKSTLWGDREIHSLRRR